MYTRQIQHVPLQGGLPTGRAQQFVFIFVNIRFNTHAYIRKLLCSDVHPRENDNAAAWNPCNSVHLRILLHVFRANLCNVEFGHVRAKLCKGASVQIRAMRLYACHGQLRVELSSISGARIGSILTGTFHAVPRKSVKLGIHLHVFRANPCIVALPVGPCNAVQWGSLLATCSAVPCKRSPVKRIRAVQAVS